MITSLTRNELKRYLGEQLEKMFPDNRNFDGNDVDFALNLALERIEFCYKHISLPLYNIGDEIHFSHLHGDQYGQFLYYFSNSLWERSQNRPICDKIMQLNRALTGCYWSYKTGFPDIFYLSHAVGSVFGKAPYGNYFLACQNCTVATQAKIGEAEQKQWGEGLYMGAGAQILNNDVMIEDWVSVGAGTSVYKETYLEKYSLIYNRDGKNTIKIREKDNIIKEKSIWRL